jgi:hypothetical protein
MWLNRETMGKLFDVDPRTISEHLTNIYSVGELDKNTTRRKIRRVQYEGKRQVEREIDFYSLDAVISVEYRVNSIKATQFRKFATRVLHEYIQIGDGRTRRATLEPYEGSAKRKSQRLGFCICKILKTLVSQAGDSGCNELGCPSERLKARKQTNSASGLPQVARQIAGKARDDGNYYCVSTSDNTSATDTNTKESPRRIGLIHLILMAITDVLDKRVDFYLFLPSLDYKRGEERVGI